MFRDLILGGAHRRKTNTKEKANVVAAARGTEFIQFLIALASFFAPGRFKK